MRLPQYLACLTAALALAVGAICAPTAARATCPASNIPSPPFSGGGSVFGRTPAQWSAYLGAMAIIENGCLDNPTINNATLNGSLNFTGVMAPVNGGTGVNNGTNTITLGGPVTFSGNYATTLTVTAPTNSTLPAGTHTLAGIDVNQVFSGQDTFSGILAIGVTRTTTTGILAACATPVCIANPGSPAATTWPLPPSPIDGEIHEVTNVPGGYALTVTTTQPIQMAGGTGTSFPIVNPGESWTFQYSAAMTAWVLR